MSIPSFIYQEDEDGAGVTSSFRNCRYFYIDNIPGYPGFISMGANHILRVIIRWPVSVGNTDWSDARYGEGLMHGYF